MPTPSSAGGFEFVHTATEWQFRPNRQTTRRMAYFHAGCLTLFVAVMLIPTIGGIVMASVVLVFNNVFPDQWVTAAIVVAGSLALIGLLPLLVIVAKHVFRKSLRDNGKTLLVAPNGMVMLGEKILVEAGRAQQVVVRTQKRIDIEGDPSDEHYVDVILDRVSAAPVSIPIPGYGSWQDSMSQRQQVTTFATILANALGVPGPEPSNNNTSRLE